MSINDEEYLEKRRRLLRYSITPALIMEMISSGSWYRFCSNNLPKDAEVLGVNADWQSDNIHIMVRSEEFEEVPEGQIVPLAKPMLIEIKEDDE